MKRSRTEEPPRDSRPTASTVLRYALLQLPGAVLLFLVLWLLRSWFQWGWTWGVAVPLAAWVAKDAVLFAWVWRAYSPERPAGPMVGLPGKAQERLAPAGWVRVRGELWRARVEGEGSPIEAGERVVVRGVRGLTLIVAPESSRAGGGTEAGEG